MTTYYDRGLIWRWTSAGPEYVRLAYPHEAPRQYRSKSPPQYADICATCRINRRCGFYGHKIYQVGWKFECPKKSDKKAWAKIKEVLDQNDRNDLNAENRVIWKRARDHIVHPNSEGELFPAADLYNHAGDDDTVKRTKYPRHSYIKEKFAGIARQLPLD